MGSAPSELSMVSSTSARPSGPLVAVPAKMTSSILPPRSVLAPCSPMTQASASTTLLLPEPLGPTTHVTPCSNAKVVEVANDLKPLSVRDLRYKGTPFVSSTGVHYGTGTMPWRLAGQAVHTGGAGGGRNRARWREKVSRGGSCNPARVTVSPATRTRRSATDRPSVRGM